MKLYKKNARIASQADFSNFSKNKDKMKAKGLVITREQGNWLIVNLNVSISESFWSAYRKNKAALKEAGYRVTRSYNMWIVY